MKLLFALACVSMVCIQMAAGHQVRSHDFEEQEAKLLDYIEKMEVKFQEEYIKKMETGVVSKDLKSMMDLIQLERPDLIKENDEMPESRQTVFCIFCRVTAGTLLALLRGGASQQTLATEAINLCTSLTPFSNEVCTGLINVNINSLYYILENRPAIDAAAVCAIVFQGSSCVFNNPIFNWAINISPGGTPITQSKGPSPNPGTNIKIVHVSDFHYDPNYQAGANAVCGQPVCCRVQQGAPANPLNAAGPWGDYRDCDSPWSVVEDVMDRINEAHPDADIIYHTGDIIDHGIWETNVAGNIQSFDRLYNAFAAKFPGKQIYNILGNHEAHPTNVFAPNNIGRLDLRTEWLYEYHATALMRWLPAATQATIRTGGYYNVLVRPGLRVIALNNNDCYTYNWWILYDPAYLATQLQWLNNQLQAAEAAGEKVHILAHIPAGEGSCFSTWSREFRRIIDRYWNTISAQFNGHTHRDEFNVYYSLNNPSFAVNVGYNGGSATTYSNVNPNYHVYTVDTNNYEINRVESYYYDLVEANQNPQRRPIWQPLYDLGADFNIPNLSPAALDTLVTRFASNNADLTRYWQNKVKRGAPSLAAGCDNACLLNHLCEIVTNQFGDARRCNALRTTAEATWMNE